MANGIRTGDPRGFNKGRSTVKVPEFDKHLKKAGGHIGRNVVEITIKMKTIVRKTIENHYHGNLMNIKKKKKKEKSYLNNSVEFFFNFFHHSNCTHIRSFSSHFESISNRLEIFLKYRLHIKVIRRWANERKSYKTWKSELDESVYRIIPSVLIREFNRIEGRGGLIFITTYFNENCLEIS